LNVPAAVNFTCQDAPGSRAASVRHPSSLSWNVTLCSTDPVFLNSTTSPTCAVDEAGAKTRLSVASMVIPAVPSPLTAAEPLHLVDPDGPVPPPGTPLPQAISAIATHITTPTAKVRRCVKCFLLAPS